MESKMIKAHGTGFIEHQENNQVYQLAHYFAVYTSTNVCHRGNSKMY